MKSYNYMQSLTITGKVLGKVLALQAGPTITGKVLALQGSLIKSLAPSNEVTRLQHSRSMPWQQKEVPWQQTRWREMMSSVTYQEIYHLIYIPMGN